MKKYDIFLFDADGTLYDYDLAEANALKIMFSNLGFNYSETIRLRYREINSQVWESYEKGEIEKTELQTLRFKRLFEGVIMLDIRELQMKAQAFFSLMILVLMISSCTAKGGIADMADKITISGYVTDFNGNPIEKCDLELLHRDFTVAHQTVSDKNGYYAFENIDKGRYMALNALRLEEYPRSNAVPEEDMRFEFWAWNIIAEENITINPRYERLELYGTTVFETYGGYNGFFVYFRPMSLVKMLRYSKDVYLDKNLAESLDLDISVKPEYLDVQVFADDEPLQINSITPIKEYLGTMSIMGYIVQVDSPKKKTDKPYIVFRVEAENKEDAEKGENIYFYEITNFK